MKKNLLYGVPLLAFSLLAHRRMEPPEIEQGEEGELKPDTQWWTSLPKRAVAAAEQRPWAFLTVVGLLVVLKILRVAHGDVQVAAHLASTGGLWVGVPIVISVLPLILAGVFVMALMAWFDAHQQNSVLSKPARRGGMARAYVILVAAFVAAICMAGCALVFSCLLGGFIGMALASFDKAAQTSPLDTRKWSGFFTYCLLGIALALGVSVFVDRPWISPETLVIQQHKDDNVNEEKELTEVVGYVLAYDEGYVSILDDRTRRVVNVEESSLMYRKQCALEDHILSPTISPLFSMGSIEPEGVANCYQ